MRLPWAAGALPFIRYEVLAVGFQGDWLYAVVIGFFNLQIWFWSVGLFCYISLDSKGQAILRGFRRRLEFSAKQIRTIE